MATQFATFVLDGLCFGVEVTQVQEVLRYQEMTRVPLAPDTVHGLINLRGQIVTALDMRACAGLTPRPEGQLPMNVVVRTDDGALSLLVDEIGDVVDVDDTQFEPVPDTLRGRAAETSSGVYKLPSQLLLALDVQKAVRVEAVVSA